MTRLSPSRMDAWRGRAGRAFLLGLCGLVVGASIAADSIVVAALKPAPNVAPVEDEVDSRVQASAELREMHPARLAITRNPIHDESNPEYHRLQKLDDAMLGVKRDVAGFPDWMMALRSGAIKPRAGLSPDERMSTFDLNVVMTNTREMPNVLFPHLSHTLWLDCANCHPYPFLPKAGANQISMSEIFRGKYCGMCHDRVAFITFFSCDRCHSVSRETREQTRSQK